MSDVTVEKSEEAIAKGSQSFAAAARLFDKATRDDAVMLYAWCRYCDDVIDGQTLGHEQEKNFRTGQLQRLEMLKQQTADALAGQPGESYIFDALHRVVARHDIPHRHPQELLAGFEMDVDAKVYLTLNDTLTYCYHVAGVVGVMMAMIMGARDPKVLDRASDLGLAFQITNICRDVIEDARNGRVYIPLDVLACHGVTSVNAADASQWPKLHAAAVDMLNRAEDYYASAYQGLSALPWRSAWAIATARRVYRAIGEKLRKDGPDAWQSRVSTSKGEKLLMLGAALGDVIATRRSGKPVPRGNLWQRPL